MRKYFTAIFVFLFLLSAVSICKTDILNAQPAGSNVKNRLPVPPIL